MHSMEIVCAMYSNTLMICDMDTGILLDKANFLA
jgi:hypothetical protein